MSRKRVAWVCTCLVMIVVFFGAGCIFAGLGAADLAIGSWGLSAVSLAALLLPIGNAAGDELEPLPPWDDNDATWVGRLRESWGPVRYSYDSPEGPTGDGPRPFDDYTEIWRRPEGQKGRDWR
jgi:hypothetical protein